MAALPGAVHGQDCLYVLTRLNGAVTAIDRATGTVAGVIALTECPQPQCMPTGLVLAEGATRAYVPRQDNGTVYVIDPLGEDVITTVGVGTSPSAAALTPDGASLYVTNLGSNAVSVIATASNAVVDTIDVGVRPRAVAVTPDGTTVFVGNSGTSPDPGTVSVINAATGAVVDTIDVGRAPAGVAVSPDGTRAYVTNGSGGTVSVIDVASLSVIDTITVGQSPRGVAFAPSGEFAYVTNVFAPVGEMSTVSVIDTASGMTEDPIALGTNLGPVAVRFTDDGTTAYVANLSGNSVSVIDTATRALDTIDDLGSPFDIGLGPCPVRPPACTGDCDGSNVVTVNELIVGVNIALDLQPASACPAFDPDQDDLVSISELIQGVNNLLFGCD